MPAARAAADGSSGEASVGEQEHMLPFERARQQRIAANRAVFVSMGLEELHQQLQQECSSGRGERKAGETQRGGGEVPRRSRRQAGKRASEAQRHSKRQAGENAELPLGMEHLARAYDSKEAAGTAPRPRPVLRTLSSGTGGAASFDRHNLMRMASMSEQALLRRARKITNPGKLASFVALLERCEGLEEVAAAANAALCELQARLCQ